MGSGKRQVINWRSRIVKSGKILASQITPHPQNPRRHPQLQQDAVAASFDELGQIAPIVLNINNGYLVDGEERSWLALDQPGDVELDAIWVDLTEDEHVKALLYFDATGDLATYDADVFDSLLREVTSDSLAIQRMLGELAGLYLNGDEKINPGAQTDKAAELQQKWQVARGDLWTIGSHKLLCGDSTNADDVARVMAGERAQLLATDPPYNVGVEYEGETDDEKLDADYEQFSRVWFTTWQAVSELQLVTPGYYNLASWCCFFEKPYHIAPWTKTNSMTRGHVSRFACFEPMLFYGRGWKRERANDVFDFPVSEQRMGNESLTPFHPCPKPVAMWQDLITSYTDAGDIVADAFGGSGTTAVACQHLGRKARLIEIAPEYCSVILQRMSDMGITPTRE